ncbi:MAG: helix-turn-helix domain-containing protein [Pseudonocardiaceae bacterium]
MKGDRPGDKISRRVGNCPPVDPALLARPAVRKALASHDIGALFRLLGEHGWTQREIVKATGMLQSSVSEIVHGRRVGDYRLLARIADGLGFPRELMGLTSGDGGAYPGDIDPAGEMSEEVRAAMRRRAMLATAGMAVASRPFQNISELGPLPGPAPQPLPSQIFPVHVVKVRDLTRRLDEAGCAYGSDSQVDSAAAAWASRLLNVPGAEPVKRALMAAVAELHLHAGWSAFDGGLPDRALYHYNRGLELATATGDAYLQTTALGHAGLVTVEDGHPNDGLKLLQLGQAKSWEIPADEGCTWVIGEGSAVAAQACARADSATALFRLGYPDAAQGELATSRELWQPTPTDPAGDLDYVAASLALEQGRLEVAEPFAAASVRRWQEGSRRARTGAEILLATIHVQAGEPDGLALAHTAITGVTRLTSIRARQRLKPLVTALHTRPGHDARELARTAHHIATTRV